MPKTITGKFLVKAAHLIQAPVTPAGAAEGQKQGPTIGVLATVEPLGDAVPIGVPSTPIEWPFYVDGAGDFFTVGSELEMTLTKV